MSSESEVRILTVESLRFPGEGSSPQGKSGPKPRTVSVVGDGQQVDIPVLPAERLTEAVTQKDSASGLMVEPVQALRRKVSEVRPS